MSDESADPFKTMGMGAGGAATLRVEDFQATFKEVTGAAARRTDSAGRKPRRCTWRGCGTSAG